MAWSLAETKMRILCLEQGDWMKPSEYPSTARDWEARQFDGFHISPNRRARDTDHPINDADSPIKIANFNGEHHRAHRKLFCHRTGMVAI